MILFSIGSRKRQIRPKTVRIIPDNILLKMRLVSPGLSTRIIPYIIEPTPRINGIMLKYLKF